MLLTSAGALVGASSLAPRAMSPAEKVDIGDKMPHTNLSLQGNNLRRKGIRVNGVAPGPI
jgi:NAD(P)-dependent dehydrogenase (short-subunit alcohol dehydrogenase family)